MDDIQENTLKTGIDGLERLFNEYKSKLEYAEQEAQEITNSAWRKAEVILTSKQSEAQQVADNIIESAKNEADNILIASRNRAHIIEKEASDKTKQEAKDRMKREIEKIEREIAYTKRTAEQESAELVESAKKEAEDIIRKAQESAQIKATELSEVIVSKATERARIIDEESIARSEEADEFVLQVCQSSEDIYNLVKTKVQADLANLSTKLNQMRDKIEVKNALEKHEAVKNDDDKTINNDDMRGRRELKIVPPYDRDQIKKLREAIKQIPNVKLDGESGTEEKYLIYLIMYEPTPILNILDGLSIVESSSVRGNTIELKLKSIENSNRDLFRDRE